MGDERRMKSEQRVVGGDEGQFREMLRVTAGQKRENS